MVLSVAMEKSPVTPPGIDPETVRLVVQCLNHYATPGPKSATVGKLCYVKTIKTDKGALMLEKVDTTDLHH